MKNIGNKLKVLKENYAMTEGRSFKSYVEMSAESDPNFFRWLFDADLEQDFDTSLTDEQRAEYADFLSTL